MACVNFLNVGRAGVSGELMRPVVETLPDACVCHVLVSSLVHQFVFDTDL